MRLDDDTSVSAATENVHDGFVHLHVHSYYSLLGSTAAPDELVARAAADGMAALALTDTNALYGAVVFSQACHAAEIAAIVGMTIRVRTLPEFVLREKNAAGYVGSEIVVPGTLVLLATGSAGYRSLCRLSSEIQGKPEREAIIQAGVDWSLLKAHSDGFHYQAVYVAEARQLGITVHPPHVTHSNRQFTLTWESRRNGAGVQSSVGGKGSMPLDRGSIPILSSTRCWRLSSLAVQAWYPVRLC